MLLLLFFINLLEGFADLRFLSVVEILILLFLSLLKSKSSSSILITGILGLD
jgi:hypothetical protein